MFLINHILIEGNLNPGLKIFQIENACFVKREFRQALFYTRVNISLIKLVVFMLERAVLQNLTTCVNYFSLQFSYRSNVTFNSNEVAPCNFRYYYAMRYLACARSSYYA